MPEEPFIDGFKERVASTGLDAMGTWVEERRPVRPTNFRGLSERRKRQVVSMLLAEPRWKQRYEEDSRSRPEIRSPGEERDSYLQAIFEERAKALSDHAFAANTGAAIEVVQAALPRVDSDAQARPSRRRARLPFPSRGKPRGGSPSPQQGGWASISTANRCASCEARARPAGAPRCRTGCRTWLRGALRRPRPSRGGTVLPREEPTGGWRVENNVLLARGPTRKPRHF